MSSELKTIGIVGAGAVVEQLHLPALQTLPNVQVSWVLDIDPGRAQRVARMFKVSKVLDDLSQAPPTFAVLAATPVGYRRRIIETLLERGSHVLSEKPFAATLQDHDQLVSAAQRAHLQIGVGLMRRCYRPTIMARALVQSGVLGAVQEVYAGEGGKMRGTGRASNWYQTNREASGGGILIETGSHLLDQVISICGASDAEVDEFKHVSVEDLDFHVDLKVNARTPTGRVPMRFSLSRIREIANGIWIRFERGAVQLETSPDASVVLLDSDRHRIGTVNNDVGATKPFQAFRDEWAAFLEQCTTGRQGSMSAQSARLSTQIVDECYARRHDASTVESP
ncbi:MAG: Gfo/Idh/MocA family oxidoreductase [Deltaproteobacteria bacterium]|nr:Gfo/Idh/MocA family oxidoreductase [Deltaproteobacteria bacterium]